MVPYIQCMKMISKNVGQCRPEEGDFEEAVAQNLKICTEFDKKSYIENTLA